MNRAPETLLERVESGAGFPSRSPLSRHETQSSTLEGTSAAFNVLQSFNNTAVIIGPNGPGSQQDLRESLKPWRSAKRRTCPTGRKIRSYRGNSAPFRCYYDRYNVRWLIRFTEPDGRERLMLRSRFLMECKLGRPLLTCEQVRHHDFDSRNDSLGNLYVYELQDLGPLDPAKVGR